MKILATVDKSREGNDCWINEEYSLIEFFGQTFMLRCEYIGKYPQDGVRIQYYSHAKIQEDHILCEIYENFLKRKA